MLSPASFLLKFPVWQQSENWKEPWKESLILNGFLLSYTSWQSYKMISQKNGQRQIWWESDFNCDRYQVNSQIQGVENVWNHHIIFWEVGDEKFELSVLIYYSFTYILVPDVIFIFDKGRPEEDTVKMSCRSLWYDT